MKILLTVFFFTVLINSLFANNLSNRECNELASEVNSALSNMHIDKVTIFENAFCPSNAKLIYNYKLTQDISQSEFEEVIADLKTKNITVWCSSPDLKDLIDVLDSVGFSYRNNINSYLGEFEIDKSYCY